MFAMLATISVTIMAISLVVVVLALICSAISEYATPTIWGSFIIFFVLFNAFAN